MSEALDAAYKAACEQDYGGNCRIPDCPCLAVRRLVNAALRAFINAPHLGISVECRKTLRAHLGEG